MPARKLELIAPNSTPIVGIKLTDGTISEFECTYDDDTRAAHAGERGRYVARHRQECSH